MRHWMPAMALGSAAAGSEQIAPSRLSILRFRGGGVSCQIAQRASEEDVGLAMESL